MTLPQLLLLPLLLLLLPLLSQLLLLLLVVVVVAKGCATVAGKAWLLPRVALLHIAAAIAMTFDIN
jgi:hypothetical protein